MRGGLFIAVGLALLAPASTLGQAFHSLSKTASGP